MVGPWRRPRISIHSGKLGRLTSRYNRWFAGVAVATILLLAIALAFVPLPEPLSGGRGFFENLDRSLFTAGVLGLAAYFWFNFWTTHLATRELLQVAQQTPEELFPHAPEAGSANHIVGRAQLVGEIADGLRAPGARPQIVVGGTGSGKTTLLLAVASHLAKEHFIVPIVLSLRDKDNDLEDDDFTELARKRFDQLVDPYVKTEAEADRLWRWMRNRGRIVVLADDLDRSPQVNKQDPYRTRIRLALDSARRRGIPLVVTTRPSGLPPDLSELPLDLSHFRLEEGKEKAAEHVLERAGQEDEQAKGLVERNIEKGDLLENAFYLSLLIGLLRSGVLEEPPEAGRHAVRLKLLDAERERLCGVLDSEEQGRREEALAGIEELATAWLVPKPKDGFESRWMSAVRDGERFGLLSLDDREHPQFKHEVLHAYYASRATARRGRWKEHLKRRPTGARVQLALVLTAATKRRDAAGTKTEEFCREACDRLLADVDGLTPDQRLLRTTSAAELAKAGSFSGRDREIAEGCLRAKTEAGPVGKRAALLQLETLGGVDAVDALWQYAQDEDYGTRWKAAECLIRRCSGRTSAGGESIRAPFEVEAYDVIKPKITRALADARELAGKEVGEWDRPIVLLKQLAWLLPSLRTTAKDPKLTKQMNEYLEELLKLERGNITRHHGLEASIAQGFKTDARLHPYEKPDEAAIAMLSERARFWYSQLNLIQALALRMAGKRTDRSLASTLSEIGDNRNGEGPGSSAGSATLHPMVRYAATLCEGVLENAPAEDRLERMSRVVWEDEGMVVSRRPLQLDRSAAQLVGDVTVLLNLSETAHPDSRRELGERATLPHCLRDSRGRHEFRDGCPKDRCGFELCPFRPTRDEPTAHRELSRAFCRDQSMHASHKTARNWDSTLGRRTLPEFWRRLESQARS